MPEYGQDEVMRRLSRRTGAKTDGTAESDEMRRNRAVSTRMARTAGATGAGGGGSQLSFATGRPRDPMFYWRQNNLPYDTNKTEELKKIRQFCRLLYMTHPIIGSCIDIYSKYPLQGAELSCKDTQLTDFYTNLFYDEKGLNYNEFSIDIGREYWTVGEAWPFASFNEVLGVWEDEELLDPDDVEVERSPFLKEPRFLIQLPKSLREVINTQSPRWEYEKLMNAYPELRHYAHEDAMMPVSNVLLRQMKFKGDTFNKRGIPILMRGLRTIVQEEMLNAAMDAIADRLYTPLILVKLGASATDLGTSVPWIPTEDDLADFEEAMDGALSGDFRVLTHHFAVDVAPVFGRENMPNLDPDFMRIEERMLQVFGLSKTMLSGASGGETYAADALNRDLISQLLTTYQNMVKSHYRERALIVAEAQEHYDYDERGGKRYVKMEEVLEVDEETGEERIVEQPKLLVPDLNMKTMNVADEEGQRQFYEALRATGVPISMKTRMWNIPIDLEDEVEASKDEAVQLAVAEQETRKATFLALRAARLPIPQDLRDDFQPMAANAEPGQPGTPGRTPTLGTDPTGLTPNLVPTGEDLAEGAEDGGVPAPGMPAMGVDPAQETGAGDDPAQRPEESDEMRADMPKASVLMRKASVMREIAKEHFVAPPLAVEAATVVDEDENSSLDYGVLASQEPQGKFGSPKHIGLRRHAVAHMPRGEDGEILPMDEWVEQG